MLNHADVVLMQDVPHICVLFVCASVFDVEVCWLFLRLVRKEFNLRSDGDEVYEIRWRQCGQR